ncbi:MAG: hypothetical protein KME60_05230 [Cyanomargarita calcarea GSE-NOS-MK-12-04C]|jgi:hypothetical protein|uniref:Uncharacterized protein n=1 Tax=Cyanomargarita calcarea GSE-NOS-MK-12-04C TaxID=2839659 RepID=A0A951QJ40_9CYAN|nr:hypothetical protein [Cyanomargarita calcarea GSE-NOS-MK-12-04C]
MARLIVEVVTAEWKFADLVYELLMYVSVTMPDTGNSVTGLTVKNFRLSAPLGFIRDFNISRCCENKWETENVEPSGCYELFLSQRVLQESTSGQIPERIKWVKGEIYPFGLQARVFDTYKGKVIHQGQTVIAIESLGN